MVPIRGQQRARHGFPHKVLEIAQISYVRPLPTTSRVAHSLPAILTLLTVIDVPARSLTIPFHSCLFRLLSPLNSASIFAPRSIIATSSNLRLLRFFRKDLHSSSSHSLPRYHRDLICVPHGIMSSSDDDVPLSRGHKSNGNMGEYGTSIVHLITLV